jgi:hypothetical protein
MPIHHTTFNLSTNAIEFYDDDGTMLKTVSTDTPEKGAAA